MRGLVAGLFFLSGACSLVYQIVWVRMLVPVFGASVFAVGIVLAAFMAGLALGSVGAGRIVDRRDDPLRVYAVVEALLGACALALPFVLARLDGLYTALYRQFEGDPTSFAAARALLSFAVLLPPATLIGATLPALGKWAVTRLSHVGRDIGMLYAVNTLGAVAGCVVVAFVALEHAGVRATTWIAAAVNLLIAAAAWGLAARAGPSTRGAARTTDRSVEPSGAGTRAATVVFWGFAASGFAALGYEVVWTRMVAVISGVTTVQSLSTVLIVFLTGLAVGGAVGARLADRLRDPFAACGVIQLALGFLGVASVPAFFAVPAILDSGVFPPSWLGHIFKLCAASAAVIALPTVLFGMFWPIAARVCVGGLDRLGRSLGGLYGANTAGAILGALVTSFVLVPALGSQRSLFALAAVNLAVGSGMLAAHSTAPAARRWGPIAAFGLPAIALALFVPTTALPQLFAVEARGELVDWAEDAGGTVTVIDYPDGRRLLKVNGAGMVPTDAASIQTFRLLGSLPLLLHDRAENVLVIAFGGGITLSTVEALGPRHIDCVELVRGVVDAAPLFAAFNGRVYERLGTERLRWIVEDGRNHVLRTPQRYDVIISDSTHPATADSWVLYTREFYELCRKRLAPGGIIAQWLPMHGLTDADHRMILRTFGAVFPHATLWLTSQYGVLLGTTEALALDLAELDRRIAGSAARQKLAEAELGDALSLAATLALDERAFDACAGAGPLNTDDRPLIGFRDRTRAGTDGGFQALIGLMPHIASSIGRELELADSEAAARLERRRRARFHAFAASIALALRDRPRAESELERALAADPSDPTALRLRSQL